MSSNRPIHVLHVNSGVDPRQGGPTTAMVALIEAQLNAGLRVTVVSTFGKDFRPDAAQVMKDLGARVRLIGPSTHFMAMHADIKPVLSELIDDKELHLVHIHGVWEEIQHQAARIAKRYRKPYLFTPHGMLDPWSLSQGALKKKLYLALRLRRDLNRAAAIHFTDETERDLVMPRLKLKPSAVVERLIVDLSEFNPLPPRGQFRSRFTQQLGDRPIALFMSRIHRKKGLDLLIPAFAKSKDKVGDSMLVIAGPDVDNYRATIEQLARDQGIFDRVLFPGMLYGEQRIAALVDADLFVLPSYQENFGIVVIESLAAGTPVLISDQVNIHRQITASDVGQVVRTNVEELSQALSRWMTDAELRCSTAQKAIEFVAREYDPKRLAQRWTELYERVARGPV